MAGRSLSSDGVSQVTELFAWDEDFGEFVLVEKLSDVTERAQVTAICMSSTSQLYIIPHSIVWRVR